MFYTFYAVHMIAMPYKCTYFAGDDNGNVDDDDDVREKWNLSKKFFTQIPCESFQFTGKCILLSIKIKNCKRNLKFN